MSEPKIDPRVQRTRKFIIDSFIELSSQKEFKDITVKDITEKAMINRATFYYHFEDIYDLLEKVLFEVLSVNLNAVNYKDKELNEETLMSIFAATTNFQDSLSNRCHRGYEDTIARIIRDQLEVIFFHLLTKQRPSDDPQVLKVTAVIMSWGMYGASVEWRREGGKASPEAFIHPALPFLIQNS